MRVARLSFQRSSTYRVATVGGAVSNTVVAFLLASVLLAVISQRGSIRGLDATGAVTFTFLVYGLDGPVGVYHPLDLTQRIRTGDVAVDLYRPYDVQLLWLAHELGRAAFHTLTRLAPPLLIGGLVFELRVPNDAATWIAFAASLWAAILLSYAYRFLLSLTAFWMLTGQAATGIAGMFVMLLSGLTIPLQLFPSWVGSVAKALPFASFGQLPAEIFIGDHPGAEAVPIVARQLMWVVVLAVGGRALLGTATRRLVVQGG